MANTHRIITNRLRARWWYTPGVPALGKWKQLGGRAFGLACSGGKGFRTHCCAPGQPSSPAANTGLPTGPDGLPPLRPCLLLPAVLPAAAHLPTVPPGDLPAPPDLPQQLNAQPPTSAGPCLAPSPSLLGSHTPMSTFPRGTRWPWPFATPCHHTTLNPRQAGGVFLVCSYSGQRAGDGAYLLVM